MANHLYDLIRSGMPSPDRVFAETEDGRRYTYRDVQDLSARYAGALVELDESDRSACLLVAP